MLLLRLFGPLVIALGTSVLVACGGNGGGGSGDSNARRLQAGDIEFEVTFLGTKKTNGEVRRAGPVEQPPPGSSWWGFELRVKNTSKTQSQSMPDVGLVCGNDSPTSAEFLNSPGFIMGEPAYATATLDAGGSNTAVVPLAVPDNATNCRFLVRMDRVHEGGTPLEFPFQ